jgi:hypothetical protein
VRVRWKEYLDNLASLSDDPKLQEKSARGKASATSKAALLDLVNPALRTNS